MKITFRKCSAPHPPKKNHTPIKNNKSASSPPFWPTLDIFQLPTHPFRKGGRTLWPSFSFTCGIVFNYSFRYDILSEENISTLRSFGGVYILPSPVFFKGEIPPVGRWEISGSGNLTRSDSDHLNLFES